MEAKYRFAAAVLLDTVEENMLSIAAPPDHRYSGIDRRERCFAAVFKRIKEEFAGTNNDWGPCVRGNRGKT